MKGSRSVVGFLTSVVCICVLGSGLQAQEQRGSAYGDRFKQYRYMPNIRDADPASLEPVGRPVRIVVPPPPAVLDSSEIGRPTLDFLRGYACTADAVIVATPRAARSEFTAEGTFIFTEFDFEVATVIRGDAPTGIRVIWPGGAVNHNGRSISTTDASYRLPQSGRKYLLFLRHIGVSAFETIAQTAGYDLTGDDAGSLGIGPLREPLKSHVLLGLAHAAANGCGK